jgi:hypothetical protein
MRHARASRSLSSPAASGFRRIWRPPARNACSA